MRILNNVFQVHWVPISCIVEIAGFTHQQFEYDVSECVLTVGMALLDREYQTRKRAEAMLLEMCVAPVQLEGMWIAAIESALENDRIIR